MMDACVFARVRGEVVATHGERGVRAPLKPCTINL